MYATVRRDEGIDRVSSEEVTSKVGDGLRPALRKLPGFGGCYVFDAGEGVFTPIALSRTRRLPEPLASPRAGRMSGSSSPHFRTGRRSHPETIRRTVQGGFHESATAQ
jgi:hypothetical protein